MSKALFVAAIVCFVLAVFKAHTSIDLTDLGLAFGFAGFLV